MAEVKRSAVNVFQRIIRNVLYLFRAETSESVASFLKREEEEKTIM